MFNDRMLCVCVWRRRTIGASRSQEWGREWGGRKTQLVLFQVAAINHAINPGLVTLTWTWTIDLDLDEHLLRF